MVVTREKALEILLHEGLKTLNIKSKIEFERESDTEVWINLVDLGVSVFYDAEGGTRRKIGGEWIPAPSYQVYTVESLPATRHEPEDVDHTMRRECERVDDAVAEVFALVVKDRIYGMIEVIGAELDAR
jgi:hypothetical protein